MEIPAKQLPSIEAAIERYLRDPFWGHADLTRERGLLPLYMGWTGTIFVDGSGEFWFLDLEDEPGTLRPENDLRWQIVSLVIGSERHPELQALLPQRPEAEPDCAVCSGTGHAIVSGIEKKNVTCGNCAGLGWVPRELREEP